MKLGKLPRHLQDAIAEKALGEVSPKMLKEQRDQIVRGIREIVSSLLTLGAWSEYPGGEGAKVDVHEVCAALQLEFKRGKASVAEGSRTRCTDPRLETMLFVEGQVIKVPPKTTKSPRIPAFARIRRVGAIA